MAQNTVKALSLLATACAPIPYLQPAVDCLWKIVEACQSVKTNRNAAARLANRCVSFIESLSRIANVSSFAANAISVLQDIEIKMLAWAKETWFKAFLKQKKMVGDISDCEAEIQLCYERFQMDNMIDIRIWQVQADTDRDKDAETLCGDLAAPDFQFRTEEFKDQHDGEVKKLVPGGMEMMFQVQREMPDEDDRKKNIQKNIYHLQEEFRILPPEMLFEYGEVQRIGQHPYSGTATADIYQGVYFGKAKVAMKAIRTATTSEKPKIIRRFIREMDMWRKVWEIDQGNFILPIYGLTQDDGPYPYLVSPWQDNGTAIQYVTMNPSVDHKALLRDIAKGIKVLHSMNPPLIHGDIKGSNVLIGDLGNPLLADFGLTKTLSEATGVPFTSSAGISASYRWLSPELLVGGNLTKGCDIYAFGMTIIELMTHEQPYPEVRQNTLLIIEVQQRGKRPKRPTSDEVVARGLGDTLWSVLERSWDSDPTERPDIQEMLDVLSV